MLSMELDDSVWDDEEEEAVIVTYQYQEKI